MGKRSAADAIGDDDTGAALGALQAKAPGGEPLVQVAPARRPGEVRSALLTEPIGERLLSGAPGLLVGTGRAGVAETFATLGLGYLVVMLIAAFSYRIPAPGWRPAGWTPPEELLKSLPQ